MSYTVIQVEKLSKRYQIADEEPYLALRDVLTHSLTAPIRFLRGRAWNHRNGSDRYIWALKDVCLEVRQGEVLGIIGRNGAGKTTLLKILSRITRPTTGRAEVRGRLGSLLEVGTGFHPELTGRENVYLSAAILGMRKSEIARRFDEIVEFAVVGRFLDTPLKHYSTGMQMRLAFSVAAHLEPEVLLVDEVLAVGDLEFQKKCLGKIENVSRSGRTVLFVSHCLGQISRLCGSAVLLEQGMVKMRGAAAEVIHAYVSRAGQGEGERRWERILPGASGGTACLRAVRVIGPNGIPTPAIDFRMPCHIEIEYEILRAVARVRTCFRLSTAEGTVAFTSADSECELSKGRPRAPGIYVSRCEIPGNFLNQNRYFVTVSADIPYVESIFLEENAVSFSVEQSGGPSGTYPERWQGVICPRLSWEIFPIGDSSAEKATPSSCRRPSNPTSKLGGLI